MGEKWENKVTIEVWDDGLCEVVLGHLDGRRRMNAALLAAGDDELECETFVVSMVKPTSVFFVTATGARGKQGRANFLCNTPVSLPSSSYICLKVK